MASDAEMDTTTVYRNGDGEKMTFAQLARAAANEPERNVVAVDDGYRFDGELYEPVDDESDEKE